MSLARVATFAFQGISPLPVEVQVQVSPGLPAFLLVGLPSKSVAESRERVRAALATIGIALPPKRVLVNLAPADLAKDGPHFDLPIALAVLAAMDILPRDELLRFAALGELSLDGLIHPVAGILPAALAAAERELGLICPATQGAEAAWGGAHEVLAAPSLPALIDHLAGRIALAAPTLPPLSTPRERGPCLAEVKGQESAKRALEIAAAGGHNLLLIGPPGSGKSMLAARLPGLLPDLTPREALEQSIVQSVAGLLEGGRLAQRPPFRAPHHSASMPALIGGGPRARPGEVSLAHAGVLFLDELPEFPRPALEALRQPLETGEIQVSRANARLAYPARVQLIAAMNPCRCGHLGSPLKQCGRAPLCAEDYQAKLSGPLLDRIDLTIEMLPIPAGELARAPRGETSAVVAARIATARARQRARYGETGPRNNSGASVETLVASLEADALTLAERATERLALSNRGFARVLRVAASIADLVAAPRIGRAHVAEALAFRRRVAALAA